MSVAALTGIGSLLSDQSRSRLLMGLMDGRAWTLTELAAHVGIARSTASEHLSRLLDAGMVTVEAQGRHRYFRLAGAEVAELLETLGSFDPTAGSPHPRPPRAPSGLAQARSCYDHLAGRAGVQLYDGLLAGGVLACRSGVLTVTGPGRQVLGGLGVDLPAIERGDRQPVRTCLDWTERRHHLGGGVGAALFQALLDRGWLRRGRQPRSILFGEEAARVFADPAGAGGGETSEPAEMSPR